MVFDSPGNRTLLFEQHSFGDVTWAASTARGAAFAPGASVRPGGNDLSRLRGGMQQRPLTF